MKEFVKNVSGFLLFISGAYFLAVLAAAIMLVIFEPLVYDLEKQATLFVHIYNSLIVLLPSICVFVAIEEEK